MRYRNLMKSSVCGPFYEGQIVPVMSWRKNSTCKNALHNFTIHGRCSTNILFDAVKKECNAINCWQHMKITRKSFKAGEKSGNVNVRKKCGLKTIVRGAKTESLFPSAKTDNDQQLAAYSSSQTLLLSIGSSVFSFVSSCLTSGASSSSSSSSS